MSVIGVPVKVLHEAEGHIVTIETTSGEVDIMLLDRLLYNIYLCKLQVYRGKLIEAEVYLSITKPNLAEEMRTL